MRKLKMCDICGLKVAKYTCANCGSSVCEDHYKNGLCTNCPPKH